MDINLVSNPPNLTGMLVVLLLALVGAIVLFILYVGPNKAEKFTGFQRKLCSHFNFDHFLVSGILKFLYLFAVLYFIASGIATLITTDIVMGILTIVLGPVIARIAFELIMVLLSIREQTAAIADLLRRDGNPAMRPQFIPQTAMPQRPQRAYPPQQPPYDPARRPRGQGEQAYPQGYPTPQQEYTGRRPPVRPEDIARG